MTVPLIAVAMAASAVAAQGADVPRVVAASVIGTAAPPSGGNAQSPSSPAEVVLFSASWCGYCQQSRAYMARAGIKYRHIDIDSAEGRVAFAAAGGGGVPLLVAKGERLRGYSALAYDFFFARLE